MDSKEVIKEQFDEMSDDSEGVDGVDELFDGLESSKDS
jgi:hypothetical protein